MYVKCRVADCENKAWRRSDRHRPKCDRCIALEKWLRENRRKEQHFTDDENEMLRRLERITVRVGCH